MILSWEVPEEYCYPLDILYIFTYYDDVSYIHLSINNSYTEFRFDMLTRPCSSGMILIIAHIEYQNTLYLDQFTYGEY